MGSYPSLQGLRVVLVETSHPGNIGAVARAMKNMGVTELVLVRPEAFPHEKSFARSAGASDLLDHARVVETLDEAIADCVEVIGASARSRSLTWPVLNPRDCADEVCSRLQEGAVALVFGREDNGLSNEELQRCHYHVQIPSNPDFSSLNLAMAVQVLTYEIRMHTLFSGESAAEGGRAPTIPSEVGWEERAATVEETENFLTHLEKTLTTTGFHNPERPRQLMVRMRRLFQRAHPDQMEINILRGILASVDRLAENSGADRDRGANV